MPDILETVKFALIVMVFILVLLLFGPELRPLIALLVNWITGMVKK